MLVIRLPRSLKAALLVSVSIGNSSPALAQQQGVRPAEVVEIPVRPLPFILKGLLRRPEGTGRFPAVVLLPFCGEHARSLDEGWGARISSWGYVTLTIDGTGPRGINHCGQAAGTYPDLDFDPYRGLNLLAQKGFVDPKRVAVVGFAWGASQALTAVERGEVEQASDYKFRAAAAFYPRCASFKGYMTVPTLLFAGEGDKMASAEACRKLVAGKDDFGISRQAVEGAPVRLVAYPHASLVPRNSPAEYSGAFLEFDKAAVEQSGEALREFLDQHLR